MAFYVVTPSPSLAVASSNQNDQDAPRSATETNPIPNAPEGAIELDTIAKADNPSISGADESSSHLSSANLVVPDVPSAPESAAGRADGDISVLRQIAHCLPPGERPDLSPATLRLSVDSKGQLTAVPVLTVDVAGISREQLRDANEIIQASMQCTPYALGTHAATQMELPANFADLEGP